MTVSERLLRPRPSKGATPIHQKRTSNLGAWALHAQQQVLALPRADDAHELLELRAFQRQIYMREALAEHLLQVGTVFESNQRLQQSARQLVIVAIGVADDGGARIELLLHPEVAAGEARRQCDVWI